MLDPLLTLSTSNVDKDILDDNLNTVFQNVLFIDSTVEDFKQYVNVNTFPIVYNRMTSREQILEILTKKFQHISRIAFVCHFEEQPYFLNNELLFSDVNTQFMIDLIKQFNVVNLDYLACRTLQNQGWKDYFTKLHDATGIPIGASDDNTGNLQYGGNWVLESTQEDIQAIYFNDQILNYSSLLTSTSVTINGLEDTTNNEISFSKLLSDASYNITGTINAFIVKSIAINGLLKIGASSSTHDYWDVNTNNTIDASHSAYWTPAPNESGPINAFTYVARNSTQQTSTIADLIVNVTPINDIPTLASVLPIVLPSINSPQPVYEDSSNIELSFVQLCLDASYSDIDGSVDAFIVTSVTNNGSLKIGSTTTPWIDGSNCTIDASHSAYWTPNPSTFGLLNVFKIVVRDNSMSQSTAHFDVNINVTRWNRAPEIIPDNNTGTVSDSSPIAYRTMVATDVNTSLNLLRWDLSGSQSQTSDYGTMSIDATTGVWTYDLSRNSVNYKALKKDATYNDQFTVNVNDGLLNAIQPQTITITVIGKNDTPTLSGDNSGNVWEDGILYAQGILTAVDVDLSGNFRWDISGNGVSNYGKMSIKLSISSSVTNTCTWSYDLSNNSSFVQALSQGQTVKDEFYVRVWDDLSANATQLITITITGKNDPIRLLNKIPNQSIDMSSNFSYVIPATTFLDIDVSDNLTYSVVLSSNTPIPSWLQFESSTRTFTSDQTKSRSVGPLTIKVTATDGYTSSSSLSAYFILNVISQQTISGSVLDGYIKFGTITVRDLSKNIVGGPVQTDQSGRFSIPMTLQPSTSYFIDCIGGTDIATGAPILYPLSSIYTSGSSSNVMLNSSNVVINPLTTIVSDIVQNNISLYQNNIVAVYTYVANAFGLQPSDIGSDYIYSHNIVTGIAAIKIATITKILSLSTGTDINTIKSKIAINIDGQTVKLLFDASFISDT